MKNLEINATIAATLAVLTKQPGYVGIGVDTSAAAIPTDVLNKFTFDEKTGVSNNTLVGLFNFETVTGERKISWKNDEGKEQFSYVLEGVTCTTGENTFQTQIPYEGYLQMKANGDPNATYTLKKSFNKAGTKAYYSTRLVGLKSEVSAETKNEGATVATPKVTAPAA